MSFDLAPFGHGWSGADWESIDHAVAILDGHVVDVRALLLRRLHAGEEGVLLADDEALLGLLDLERAGFGVLVCMYASSYLYSIHSKRRTVRSTWRTLSA